MGRGDTKFHDFDLYLQDFPNFGGFSLMYKSSNVPFASIGTLNYTKQFLVSSTCWSIKSKSNQQISKSGLTFFVGICQKFNHFSPITFNQLTEGMFERKNAIRNQISPKPNK